MVAHAKACWRIRNVRLSGKDGRYRLCAEACDEATKSIVWITSTEVLYRVVSIYVFKTGSALRPARPVLVWSSSASRNSHRRSCLA